MRTSIRGMLALAHHEAVVTNRYKDSVGVWTIGIGATKHALPNSPYNPEKFTGDIPVDKVFEIFLDTLIKYERGVNLAMQKRKPEQHEFDAAVSFHYNTGAINRASWVKLWNNHASNPEIEKAFMQWRKPPEIIKRRRQECDLLLTGKYPANDIPLYTADANGRVKWREGTVIKHDRAVALLDPGGTAVA
jgi:lysozyme